ncbi:hypothetical protein Q7P37_006405 [Cladosporium fusiforme]
MDVIAQNLPHALPPGAEHYIDFYTARSKPRNVTTCALMERALMDSTHTGSVVSRVNDWRDIEEAMQNESSSSSQAEMVSLITCLDDLDAKFQKFHDKNLHSRNQVTPQHPGWETATKNHLKLDLHSRRPDHVRLEKTKVFLPQGAALILRVWQEELNEFVTAVEEWSIDPEQAALQKISSYKIYNLPRCARPPYGEFDVVKYHKLPALKVVETSSHRKLLSIPQLATRFARGIEEECVTLVVNNLANAPEEHVKEIIEALKALPQMQVDATNMSARNGVNKSRKTLKQGGKGPKRPLNSWMAFRKFYNQMLSPRTQKVKSTILTALWKEDPFGAKWSILAKGYSILRGDRDKEEVSLGLYLAHCAPLVGIIPPHMYLDVMGWELGEPNGQVKDGSSHVTRKVVPDVGSFPAGLMTTTLSVEDLVNSCIENRLFSAPIHNSASGKQSSSLAMAVQPRISASTDVATGLPLAEELLRASTAEITSNGTDDDAITFDPTGGVDSFWNPATYDSRHEDNGVWDGFNIEDEMLTGVLATSDVDFASFVNAEHIA